MSQNRRILVNPLCALALGLLLAGPVAADTVTVIIPSQFSGCSVSRSLRRGRGLAGFTLAEVAVSAAIAGITVAVVALPLALAFGDVYHPRSGALAQANHVFLAGNGLPLRADDHGGTTATATVLAGSTACTQTDWPICAVGMLRL